MRVLVDTNVLLDVLAKREEFFEQSFKIFELCQEEKIYGCIAAHSIPNIVYILRKNFSLEEVKAMLKSLCKIFYVDSLDVEKIQSAIDDKIFTDFEDCLQVQSGIKFQADYIITRDLKDFRLSPISAITPDDFCKLFEPADEENVENEAEEN